MLNQVLSFYVSARNAVLIQCLQSSHFKRVNPNDSAGIAAMIQPGPFHCGHIIVVTHGLKARAQ